MTVGSSREPIFQEWLSASLQLADQVEPWNKGVVGIMPFLDPVLVPIEDTG